MNSSKSLSLLVPLGFNFAFGVISFFAAIPSILQIGRAFHHGGEVTPFWQFEILYAGASMTDEPELKGEVETERKGSESLWWHNWSIA
jgi:hypothetical protein